jgi:hypothetical protein
MKKNPINKNQGWVPIHQKYKAKENTIRHNPKKKTKAKNQPKSGKDLLMAMKLQSTITKKT